MKRPIHRRWWFVLLEVLLIVSIGLTVVLSTTTVLQKNLIRLICAGNAGIQPPDYDALAARVDTLEQDLSYDSRFPMGTLDLYTAQSDESLPLIVYAHGGYYVGDDKEDFTYYCQKLASCGYVVANIDYQLAPEGQYPTQILQVNEAVAYLADHSEEYGIDKSRVFIGGDSAGAHLASQMGLYYTLESFRASIGGSPALAPDQLHGVLLLCGYYNTETVRETRFPLIADSVWMLTGIKRYEGTEVSALMNTVAQVNSDYPPAFIACGNTDPFLPQAKELDAALTEYGVQHTTVLPGSSEEPLWHEYQRDLTSEAGVETMDQLSQFLLEQSAVR